jgi:hypothetical protein
MVGINPVNQTILRILVQKIIYSEPTNNCNFYFSIDTGVLLLLVAESHKSAHLRQLGYN